MSTTILSLVLDIAVLTALAGTIYFALRLSSSLNNFRAHRNEMKSLIAELTKNINDAQTAIEGLKATSNIAADNLEDVLHDSRRMAEELRMINETSDSLANRLEGLASQKGVLGEGSEPSYFDADEEEEFFEEPRAANTDDGPIEPPSFFIQDREFDDADGDDNTDSANETFVSEAERELLQALQGRKKSGRG